MRSAKYIVILFGLLIIQFGIYAQQVVDFSGLEESINKQNREDVILQYNRLFEYFYDSGFEESDFEQFLNYSHQLSILGYAEMVSSNLEKFSKQQIQNNYPKVNLCHYYNELGYSYYYGNNLEQSDSVFHLNLALRELHKEIPPLDFSFSYNFLGLIHRKKENYSQAIEYFEMAKEIRISELGENHPQVGSIYNNIGLVYKSSGDFENALTNYEKAIDIKLLSNDVSVYRNYINMGEVSTIMGNYSSALNYYKKADNILSIENERAKLADLYFNMGGVYNILKANRDAYEYFQKALTIYTEIYGNDDEKVAKVYQNLAIVYDELGELEQGRMAIEKSISILKNEYGNASPELAPLYNNLGLVYQDLENYQLSLFYLKKAGQIYQDSESEISEKYLNTLTNLAESYSLSGSLDSSINYFHDVVENLDQMFDGKHPLLAYCYNQLGEIYYAKGEPEKALSFANEAILANVIEVNNFIRIAKKSLDPSYLFDSYLLLGKIAFAGESKNEEPEAKFLYYFQLADSILSFQRNFLSNKKDKIQLAKNSKRLAEFVLESFWAKSTTLTTEELEIVFRFVEKSKNLVLLQSMSENTGKNYAGIPDSVLLKEENLLSKINSYNHQLEIENDSLQKLDLEEKLFIINGEYKLLVKNLENDYPKYYELKFKEDVPNLKDIEQKLNNDEVLLSYFVCEKSIYRFSVSNTKADLKKLNTDDCSDLITGMRKSIELQLDEIYLQKAHDLYQLLIPENLHEELKTLIIVPDGGFSVLPFEALLTKHESAENEAGNWSYLLKQFRICYSPSSAIFVNHNRTEIKQNQNKSLLAFAPVFERISLPVAGTSSFSTPTDIGIFNSNLNDLGLAPLYASKNEVQSIEKIFTNNHFDTNIHLFSEADEGTFTNHDLTGFSFVHIATHGFVDKKNPELSGLYFAPVENEAFDNILYTGEIYNLKLNTELLTLSACQTALGKVADGEGILGFSRAFLYAGAKNLVLSLWKVNDVSTSTLMTSFYTHILNENLSFSDALATAKLGMIEGGKFSHPYYWAPFILIGN